MKLIKLNRKQAEEKINGFFSDLREKTPEQIRKIKRLAMHHKVKLGDKRKKFCKFCYSPRLRFIKIKNKIKSVRCENCGRLMRWKIGLNAPRNV